MATCEVCGNEYARAFTVEGPMGRHTFDCFECAIHALAPVCGHCGCRIIGHGIEASGEQFCCEHCSRMAAGGTIDLSAEAGGARRSGDDGRGTTVGQGGDREPAGMHGGDTSRWNVPG